MGLSQPKSAVEDRRIRAHNPTQSGYGYELAVLADQRAPWAAELLYDAVTYFTEPDAEAVGSGDRIAFGVYLIDGKRRVMVGGVEDREPVGNLRGLLVWTYRQRSSFATSTGETDVLVLTGITEGEWELAKTTSSQHLVLLLERAGIGQLTVLDRDCVSRDASAMAAWREISKLHATEAWWRATRS